MDIPAFVLSCQYAKDQFASMLVVVETCGLSNHISHGVDFLGCPK